MPRRNGWMLAWMLGAAALARVASADPVDLKPFKATYTLEWKGLTAGNSTLELRRAGPDQYTYSSVNTARGLFRLAFSDALVQSSTFKVANGRVVPLTFKGNDEKQRPIDLTFDWTRMRVTGTAKEHAVDIELPPDAQDPMSLQIASLRDLAAGKLKDVVWMLDADKMKDFELKLEGTARIDTELGEFDTMIYTSQRVGSDRVTRTWVAPTLGYLPVKAERVRGKKTDFTLNIQSVERD